MIPKNEIKRIGMASLLFASIGLSFNTGCAPDPDTLMNVESKTSAIVSDRIKVTRIGIFEDKLAYDARRGIYIIEDTKTGKEYIGVSGIGISELGSHIMSTGKSAANIPDER